MNPIFEYYTQHPNKKAIWWEILKDIRGHEVGFVPLDPERRTFRFIRIGQFDFLINKLHAVYNRDYWKFNFFRSIEHVRVLDENKNIINLQKNWEKAVYGFDFVMDIDTKFDDHEKAIENSYQVAIEVFDFLKKNKIEFEVKATASKGFHFIIDWDVLKNFFKPTDFTVCPVLLDIIVENVSKKNRKFIDKDTTKRRKGLFRVKYSMHPKTQLIALPLTEKEFNSFEIGMLEPHYLNNMNLRLRKLKINSDMGLGKFTKTEIFENLKDFVEVKRVAIVQTKDKIKENFRKLDKKERINILKELEGNG